tara:strand:+ start:494 stop:1852 length:1359 start_codon:yes stop_codon:yes gene_type:complete
MSKILATIGPASDSVNDIKKITKITSTLRINGSHNSLNWHKKISKRIKDNNPSSTVLLDVPGIKPRTANIAEIKIKKGEKIIFAYKKSFNNKLKVINISNPLPHINKNTKYFTISDGQFEFSLVRYEKNFIVGRSKSNFNLLPKKGLNIPYSIYDEKKQLQIYSKFINKYKDVNYDALGLSFIQSSSILNKIKSKYKNIVIVAKIENYLGLKNVDEICESTDVVMIDRGDLGAEIGNNSLYKAIVDISKATKKNGKSLIMATENLDSMLTRQSPNKSDIVGLAFSLSLQADKIMLSDETATSSNWYSSLKWLNIFLRNNENEESLFAGKEDTFWNIIRNLPEGVPIVIFSKKGIAVEKISKIQNTSDLIIFTDDKKTSTLCSFRSNAETILIDKFGEKEKNEYVYKAILNNRNRIFKKNKNAILIYIYAQRKGSRANSISLLEKKDFYINTT